MELTQAASASAAPVPVPIAISGDFTMNDTIGEDEITVPITGYYTQIANVVTFYIYVTWGAKPLSVACECYIVLSESMPGPEYTTKLDVGAGFDPIGVYPSTSGYTLEAFIQSLDVDTTRIDILQRQILGQDSTVLITRAASGTLILSGTYQVA